MDRVGLEHDRTGREKTGDVSKATGPTHDQVPRRLTSVTGAAASPRLSLRPTRRSAMSAQNQVPRHYERRLFPALFVIALGVLFLLRNLGVGFDFFQFHNWWAWLILVAAIAPLARAVELYRASGKFDGNILRLLLMAAMIAT